MIKKLLLILFTVSNFVIAQNTIGTTLITEDVYDGYTLFTPSSHQEELATTLLMDNDYNIIHSWMHERQPASMPYLFSDGSITQNINIQQSSGGIGGGG